MATPKLYPAPSHWLEDPFYTEEEPEEKPMTKEDVRELLGCEKYHRLKEEGLIR